ncbi:MAG: tRNA (adenosine(37)-N6)-threonylcarbamoyltransferase complex transferase subunit TsaD [Patescibacteria group bacterium]
MAEVRTRILAIETSCDETAVAIIEGTGGLGAPQFRVLASEVFSQIDLHAVWGGVVPNLARREHEQKLIPVLSAALAQAKLLKEKKGAPIDLAHILNREIILRPIAEAFLSSHERPDVEAIAVTVGPGLEPALWTGINLARALASVWNVPIIPVNHMAGHIAASLLLREMSNDEFLMSNKTHKKTEGNSSTRKVLFPALALLVSGGHTEIVLATAWGKYEVIGSTRDDAAGEAFDKTARLLDLPYPGGPALSALARSGKRDAVPLPRPMIKEKNLDFSFSGLKTAVRYHLRDNPDANRADLAASIEEAICDVLIKKTFRAIEKTEARTLILGGGVAANTRLRFLMEQKNVAEGRPVTLLLPHPSLTTDNAAMIGAAGYINSLRNGAADPDSLRADGSLSL